MRRELYTDGGVVVQRFKRGLVVTAVGLPALKGDLASRSLPIELEDA